jgi:hypothetical protein
MRFACDKIRFARFLNITKLSQSINQPINQASNQSTNQYEFNVSFTARELHQWREYSGVPGEMEPMASTEIAPLI